MVLSHYLLADFEDDEKPKGVLEIEIFFVMWVNERG